MAHDTAKRLLAQVRKWRKANGLSQEAFAERAGLSYKYYQLVETGRKKDFRFSTLEKLIKACGLELWDMLQFEPDAIVLGEERPEEGSDAGPSPGKVKRRSRKK